MDTAIVSYSPRYKTICFIPEHLDYYLENLSSTRHKTLTDQERNYIYQGVYRTLYKVKGMVDIANTLIFLIENVLNTRLSSIEADVLMSLIKFMEYEIKAYRGYELINIHSERSLVCITVKIS